MTRLISTVTVLLLVLNSPLNAEPGGFEMPDLFQNKGIDLYPTSLDLPLESYEYAARRNQRIINQAVMGYMDEKLESMGSAGTALKYSGAAAYMAIKGAKLHLDDKKTMAIELNEPADSDRELIYSINISW